MSTDTAQPTQLPKNSSLQPPKPNKTKKKKSKEKTKEPPNLTCALCRYTFSDISSYKRHTVATLNECVGYYFTCKRCLKPFITHKQLLEHQKQGEEECSKYTFENKIELQNRVITQCNILNEGYKSFIRKFLTPVVIDTQTQETRLNFKLIKLVFDSLSNKEFVEMIKFITIECPDLKFYLLASLKFYIEEAPPEKTEKIKEYFTSNRVASFK